MDTDEVQIRIREGAILIASAHRPRSGWADAARDLRERGEDRLLEEPAPTRFDLEDWECEEMFAR